MLEKHSYLTQRDSVDWLTVECAPEKLVSFVQSLRDLEGFEITILNTSGAKIDVVSLKVTDLEDS